MNKSFVHLLMIYLGFILMGFDGALLAEPETKAENSSPFSKDLPQSIFHETQERDPFLPVGYKKPLPQSKMVAKPPIVDFKLNITGISIFESGITATLESGEIVEPNQTYPWKNKEGKVIAEYKIITISDNGVIALYEGKEYEFKMKGFDLNNFKEKEETHEKDKPQ